VLGFTLLNSGYEEILIR